jgi:hypothetical protein
LHLKPLPAWISEVYRLQQRMVDIEGYVALNSNRYSVPVDWIGRRVEVRETKDKIEIQLDVRRLVTHRRIAEAEQQRVMLPEHRPPRGQRDARPDPHPEEKVIVTAAPELADYVAGLKRLPAALAVGVARHVRRWRAGLRPGAAAKPPQSGYFSGKRGSSDQLSGRQNQVAFSPDGNQIVFVWEGTDGGASHVFVKLSAPRLSCN